MKMLCTMVLLCGLFITLPALSAQSLYGKPDAPLVAEVLGTRIHTADAEEMKYVLLGRLLDRYATEQGISVSQADIDAYIGGVARIAERDRQRRAERREELVRQLASAATGKREAVEAELRALDQLEADLGEADSGSSEARAAREEVATAFIRQWKLNRALYRQYGGRIVFQQGGPEPLDAYRVFLEDRQKQGAFRILDPSLERAFWKYYLDDSIHSFYPAGSRKETQAFEAPWWLPASPAQTR